MKCDQAIFMPSWPRNQVGGVNLSNRNFSRLKFTLLRKTRDKIAKRHSNMVIRPDEDGTTSEKPTSEYHLSVITGGQHEQ